MIEYLSGEDVLGMQRRIVDRIGGIHGDHLPRASSARPRRSICRTPAEIRGVDNNGIDHERPAGIVLANLEGHVLVFKPVTSCDRC